MTIEELENKLVKLNDDPESLICVSLATDERLCKEYLRELRVNEHRIRCDNFALLYYWGELKHKEILDEIECYYSGKDIFIKVDKRAFRISVFSHSDIKQNNSII